jgi:hypothetical protein
MTRDNLVVVGTGSAALMGGALLLRYLSLGWGPETRPHVLNDRKFVDARPSGLADAAGVTLEVYALASCMQSEESRRPGQVAVGWAVRNYCRRHRCSVADQLLKSVSHGRRRASHGHFASQEAAGKWASTAKPPTAGTLVLAQEILADRPRVPDPTGGASSWDSPALQDRKHAEDPATYPKDSRQVAADREAAGGVAVRVPGVPGTRFWRFA